MATYNRVFTKKKWEQVNKYNKELMEDYLMELRAQKKSEGTRKQYMNDLRIIFIYILENEDNKPIHKLKKKQYRNMMLHFQERELSNARINRIFSALRSMLEFGSLEEEYEDDLEINYASKVKGLAKSATRDIVFLTDEEVEYIYNRLIEKKRYQQALFIALMYDSAGRRNECYQVTKDSITEDGNFTNLVIGKRGKSFRLLYNDRTREAHKLYMNRRGEDNLDTLWITKSNGNKVPASYETLYAWVVAWRKILAEKFEYKEFNPHSFRHSCADNLENGTHYVSVKLGRKFEIFQIQKLMNHDSIETTMSYLQDKSQDELLKAFGLF
ncbi:MAG: tyrosine-type recombinase/integrase [Paraclostridium sp.]